MTKVDAVIVTFNRKEKLKHALECYDKQEVPFRNIIVVDNCSTDGTDVLLKAWQTQPAEYGKHVLSLPHNAGGSGGFYAGEKYALTLQPDWVFISDDDAYPESQLVKKLLEFEDRHKGEPISAICSAVLDMNGDLMTECRSQLVFESNGIQTNDVQNEEYSKDFFLFDCLSYVGAFLNAAALKEKGLVNKDFFIYQDDVEHSLRLRKFGPMVCLPDMKVVHDSVPLSQTTQSVLEASLWKEYYAARNRAYLLLKHCPRIGRKYIFHTLLDIKARKDASLSAVAKMSLEGIKDARRGKLGIHDFYRPGLVIESNAGLPYPKFRWALAYPILRIIRLFKK